MEPTRDTNLDLGRFGPAAEFNDLLAGTLVRPVVIPGLRPTFVISNTLIPPIKVSATTGRSAIEKLPVDSLMIPTSEIAPPPTRLAIALMPARPAAAARGDIHADDSAQNGPLNE